MTSEAVIEYRDVWKKFPKADLPTLSGLNLEIQAGSIHVLVGFSGTGKSVTIKHALGLMEADRGEVRVMGKRVDSLSSFDLRELRKNFGMLFQGVALFDSLNVFENIAFPIREHRPELGESELTTKVEALLDAVELGSAIWKMPEELSGGMKKRVGLARAMALSPKILICDEPTTGLDPVTAVLIDNLIAKSTRTLNASAFLISHDIHAAMRIADTVSMIFEGAVIETGSPHEFKKSQHKVVKHFLESAGVI